MNDRDAKGSASVINRGTIAGALLVGAPIGIQTLVPMVWPTLDHGLGLVLLMLCAIAFALGVAILWFGNTRFTTGTPRCWRVVGMGQGWVEARVRSDAGDQMVVTWNLGGAADTIDIQTTFRKRSRPRRSDVVEMIFDVDGASFEWDIADGGEAGFTLSGETWRDVEAIKSMLAAMREGTSLAVLVPTLGLRAQFTLDGAFDTLKSAATLGEEPEEAGRSASPVVAGEGS